MSKTRLGPSASVKADPANRMATQSEHVIASSWRVSASPPFQSQHPRTSMLGETCVCVLPSHLSRPGPVTSLPGLLACDQAQAP